MGYSIEFCVGSAEFQKYTPSKMAITIGGFSPKRSREEEYLSRFTTHLVSIIHKRRSRQEELNQDQYKGRRQQGHGRIFSRKAGIYSR